MSPYNPNPLINLQPWTLNPKPLHPYPQIQIPKS